MKVLTLIGTRPEIIKLSRVIAELDQRTEHVLVHSGQNFDYELNEIFFQQLQVRKPDYFLNAAGGSTAETIGNIIARSDEVFAKEQPDAMLILGDTNSALSVISAKKRKIPIFHMEAGNRCFDQRVPEEINRKIIDHTSDINIVFSEHARRYLLAEGIRPETVIKSGSPMREVLNHYLSAIENSAILDELQLEPGNYFIVSAHREENVDSEQNLSDLLSSLDALAERYGLPLIVSTHPRTKNRLDERGVSATNQLVRFLKPLGFLDYVKLQLNARCIVSDSGTITEEASILDLPAVTIRQAHERPEGMDEATLIMCGLKSERVLEAVSTVVAHATADGERSFKMVSDYETDNVSKKIVRIIMSYTDYVNRTVWHR